MPVYIERARPHRRRYHRRDVDTFLALCSACTMKSKGFDVSQFGGVPDMAALAADGFTWCIVRITSGTATKDKLAERQIEAANRAGVPVLAGYSYIRSDAPAEPQVDLAIDRARELGLRAVAPDCEPVKDPDKVTGVYPRATDAPSIAAFVFRAWVRRYLDMTKRWPLAYGGANYLRLLSLPSWMSEAPLWCADYTGELNVPPPWTNATIRQVKGNVKLEGGAAIDVNESPFDACELGKLLHWS